MKPNAVLRGSHGVDASVPRNLPWAVLTLLCVFVCVTGCATTPASNAGRVVVIVGASSGFGKGCWRHSLETAKIAAEMQWP